jgi:predicted anti-sigma-YlaC factor YlaD
MAMECRDVLERISDYLDLDPQSERELAEHLEAHLTGCTNCRVYVDTVKRTIALYRSETPPDCPEPVRLRLHAVLSYEYKNRK